MKAAKIVIGIAFFILAVIFMLLAWLAYANVYMRKTPPQAEDNPWPVILLFGGMVLGAAIVSIRCFEAVFRRKQLISRS
jgi:hypothetical protein